MWYGPSHCGVGAPYLCEGLSVRANCNIFNYLIRKVNLPMQIAMLMRGLSQEK